MILSERPSAAQGNRPDATGQFAAGQGSAVSLRRDAATSLALVFLASLSFYAAASLVFLISWKVAVSSSAVLAVMFGGVLRGLCHHHHEKFGPANTVTAIRAAMVSLVAAVVLFAEVHRAEAAAHWALAGLAALALALDGLDGYLARRFHQESELGARFDMEVDALLILCLSAAAWQLGKAGPWVLLIGLMRYGFVLAQYVQPRLAAPLPPSFRRKLVCVVQVATLCVLLLPPVTAPLSIWIAGVALAALTWSFAVDTAYLLRKPEAGH
ncbi:sn-1,2-diacylglycerol ethanolamine- and cholinephosphotranferases [Pannonibacter phragmitetus]|uniref:sn-1,2-diacylglycerol ethanolamine- and cholinephosphotranferases n=1 Tax=Pannonibacter phragmitetus TaxID=121719 RepID=A0A378ZXX7_9HYPH|nr:CDP-alcohol phosphatidyltransferase family protein [Pannonibacter phragmitetus]SUB02084.1 sn-1,2-diacylglycerol ethanolamine- and cholinephosphotranferases [Pannonibacter phragmitetus]